MTHYTVQIAVAANGNPSLTVQTRSGEMHPNFPPMALPGREFPTAIDSEDYTTALLRACRVIAPDYSPVWISSGYTIVNGTRLAVRTAPLPE